MKLNAFILTSLIGLVSLSLVSCEDKDREDNRPLSKPEIQLDSIGLVRTGSVLVYGNVTNSGNLYIQGKGIFFTDDPSRTLTFGSIAPRSAADGGGTFSIPLTGLKPRTTYRARFFARNYIDTAYSQEFTFFSAPTLGSVTAASALEVGRDTVKVSSTLTGNGSETILDRGFIIGRSTNPQINTKKGDYNFLAVDSDSTRGTTFTGIVRNLEPGKTYYLRPYVRNRGGIGYGPQAVVTTQP